MVYIKGLKFRGFKSFRRAEASFPPGYVCLAGPNGSGKSNVTDGIRFALGEASLKSLRAKRVSELINTSCKYAEVTLFIDGEKQYEIKRAINAEGKTLYRINGRRSTRTLVMEELRQYGLEAGSHNIIAQGQVQKIVEMSAKERRQIIDSVAGISEFDAKKEEALRELEKVQQKITEASIVLGEREAMLADLEKEKNDALSYLSAQENYKRAMASIANSEFSKLQKFQSDIVHRCSEAAALRDELSKQSAVLRVRMAELDSQRQQLVSKISSSGSRESAMAEIEELKVKCSADSAKLVERRKDLSRLESESKSLRLQTESLKKAQQKASGEISQLSSQAAQIQKQLSELESSLGASSGQEGSVKKLESISEKIAQLRERKAALDASNQNSEKMLEMRRQERLRLAQTIGESRESKAEGERSVLQKDVLAHEAELERLFEREKELNRKLPDLDRRLLSLKERAATLRATLSPTATSLALRVVGELKSGGMKGIYGPVSSLISCDPKHSVAVEAAAGQRLNYVVVDCMDTAIKVIGRLKEQKSGRCTFIPLDIQRQGAGAAQEKWQGCLGTLLSFVDFDAAYLSAMGYVFGDTLLFDTVQNAKKAGVGKLRMVSLEGELIEKSGIISGGVQKGSLLSRSALEKAESEAEKVKQERESFYSELYSLREEMSRRRKDKAVAEVRLRGLELELEAESERMKDKKKTLEAISEIDSHLDSIAKDMSSSKKEADMVLRQLSESISQHESLRQSLAAEAEAAKQADADSQRRLRELHASRSSLLAQSEARRVESDRLSSEQKEKELQFAEISSQLESRREELSLLESGIAKITKLRQEKEQKLSEMSAASQKLLSRLKELETQVSEIGVQIGRLRAEEEKKSRELMDLEVKRQTTETRLADIKATLEQYAGVSTIELGKQELEELATKSRLSMEALGAVNLRAPELYDEKKKDIDEIKSRVSSLDSEKKAVLAMMDEIEGKKREIFISTFSSVNDNFKKLFGYIFPGEGMLLLEQPSSPFESGLLVKVRDNSHDKYLDSMSGGEKSLLALIFIFSIQMHKAAPFYILDEADAALDKENSKKLAELIKQLSGNTQFLVVTHNDTVLSSADVALGVTRTEDGSKIVGVQLTSAASVARLKKV